MKKVIFIGNFIVPDGSAAGLRVWNIGKVFKFLGYTPLFISFSKNGKVFDYQKDDKNEFEIYSAKYPSSSLDWFRLVKRFNIICKLLGSMKLSRETILYFYGSQSISLLNLLLLFKFKRFVNKIIYDSVDHLVYKTHNLLFDLFKNLDVFIQNNVINYYFSDLIVISNYFYLKYKSPHRNIILIPPIFERVENISSFNRTSEMLSIAYIGYPFRTNKVISSSNQVKDRLDLIVKSFIDHIKCCPNSKLSLKIIGLDLNTFLQAYPYFYEICDNKKIQFFGKVENSFIREIYNTIDFTILIRDINTTSLAGFPSKVAESISFGVPVIVNDFGDIKKYIKDNYNGFISGEGPNSLTAIFNKLSLINSTELYDLKEKTLKDNPFLLQNYISTLEKFILR
jgi:glycosyltransferase involved in cell wall biosynthesis